MLEKMCQCGMRSTGRCWGQMSHHDERDRTYLNIRERSSAHRSITTPVTCPGWYPVKVPFCCPETSRYLVGMWVDNGAIGKRTKMYRGRVQGNEFIQSRSRRENINTRESRGMSVSRSGGIVAVVQRGGEEDQAEEEVGSSERRHGESCDRSDYMVAMVDKIRTVASHPRLVILVINMRYDPALVSFPAQPAQLPQSISFLSPNALLPPFPQVQLASNHPIPSPQKIIRPSRFRLGWRL
jgi:hypothetical protein